MCCIVIYAFQICGGFICFLKTKISKRKGKLDRKGEKRLEGKEKGRKKRFEGTEQNKGRRGRGKWYEYKEEKGRGEEQGKRGRKKGRGGKKANEKKYYLKLRNVHIFVQSK